MSPTTLNTTFKLDNARISRADSSRRAYLDTYAKKRTSDLTKPGAQQPERIQKVTSSIPNSFDIAPVLAHPKKRPSPSTLKALSRRAIMLSRAHSVMRTPVSTPVTRTVNQYLVPAESNETGIEANLQALYRPSLTEQLQKSDSKSDHHIRTVLVSALACGVLSLSIFAFMTKVDTQPVVAQPVGATVIEVEVPVKQASPKGKSAPVVSDFVAHKPTDPVKIVISSIGVNAQVEGLGITSDGLIAVPRAYGLVGWYNKGKTVGDAGPAVLVGHYASGGGAVFDKLGDTKDGDLITITTAEGKNYTYKISKKVEYPKDKVPMKQIFKSGDESRLEIITCQGVWSGANYNNRLVVTAQLVK